MQSTASIDVGAWSPRCDPPRTIVTPVRVDPHRLTRGRAYGARWRAVGSGLFVPADVDGDVVEQRIVEVAAAAGPTAALTGWAALRLHGAAYFDGRVDARRRPVAVVDPARQLRSSPERRASRAALPAHHVVRRARVAVTVPERALVDELLALRDLDERVVAVDMAYAGEVTSPNRLEAWLRDEPRGRGWRHVEAAFSHADEHVRSPPESRLRQRWTSAGLPRPLCNRAVLDLDGRRLGTPDLLDVEAGVAIEYDGAAHRTRARHRTDTRRREGFDRVGLVTLVVVAGDLDDDGLVARFQDHRARGLAQPGPRRWAPAPRASYDRGVTLLSLDERIERREAAESLDGSLAGSLAGSLECPDSGSDGRRP